VKCRGVNRTLVCRVDECSEERRHVWQLKRLAMDLRSAADGFAAEVATLSICLKEARLPDGTRLECWLKSAHWIFRFNNGV
jgi:hypothetical protein